MRNITLMDGAVGTSLWEKSGDSSPVWQYNVEKPEIVAQLASEYVNAGAEIILANTFAVNAPSLKRTQYEVKDVISRAMAIVKSAVMGRAKIALSVGPLPILLEPYGDLTEDEATEIYSEIISEGVVGGADIIYMQTFMDLELMKVAVKVADRYDLPVFSSFSFDKRGKTMMGNSVTDIINEMSGLRLDAVGLNCSLGPDLALPVIKEFSENTDKPLIFKPNAGKPISGGVIGAEFDVETFVNDSIQALEYGVKYIGGCCGSNAKYISRLHEKLLELGE